MTRGLIPTLFRDEEEIPMRTLSSLLENWGAPLNRYACTPDMALHEEEAAFVVEAALPGVKADEIKVHLKEGVLYISGEKKETTRKQKLRSKFSYQIALPQSVDEKGKIEAETKDGILTITLPKAKEARALNIEVK